MRAAAVVVLLLLSASACKRQRPDDPVTAYELFAKRIQRDDVKGAFQGLSTPTQELLTERAKAMAKASAGSLSDHPVDYLFLRTVRAAQVTSVKLVKEDDATATLSVESGGQVQTVHMVKEASGWRVDLTEQLKNPPASGAADGAAAPG